MIGCEFRFTIIVRIEIGRPLKNTAFMLIRRTTSVVVILSQLVLAGAGHALHGLTCSEHGHAVETTCDHDHADGGHDHGHHGHTCGQSNENSKAVAAKSDNIDQPDGFRLTAAGHSHSLHDSANCVLCQTLSMSLTLASATDVVVAVQPVTGEVLYTGPAASQLAHRPHFARGPPVSAV
ncbi:hypothetical protein [Stratiformator vulcanicus]|uniref:Uncharacterized protein n=1 Tax=Stratiformator vulcanicus TaxID=2527980 RepID=A0A517QYE1_9PLAN|nr:hypothetical protein [Stratiformator vulcanicus]QDT36651.1 hypothetical protein Pan189_10120 [Stratiformator vulcanicus]